MGGSVNATFDTVQGAKLTYQWVEEVGGYLIPVFRSNSWEFIAAFLGATTLLDSLLTMLHFGLKWYRLRNSSLLLHCIVQVFWLSATSLITAHWFFDRFLFARAYVRPDYLTRSNYLVYFNFVNA
jgi:hypothetical protein